MSSHNHNLHHRALQKSSCAHGQGFPGPTPSPRQPLLCFPCPSVTQPCSQIVLRGPVGIQRRRTPFQSDTRRTPSWRRWDLGSLYKCWQRRKVFWGQPSRFAEDFLQIGWVAFFLICDTITCNFRKMYKLHDTTTLMLFVGHYRLSNKSG